MWETTKSGWWRRAGTTLAMLVAATAWAAPAEAATHASAPLDENVSIGPDRTIHLECKGAGGPTVVLIAGGFNSGAIWSMPFDFAHPGPTVFPAVSKFTRVCAYDRPGTASPAPNDQISVGTSTPVPQPTTPVNGVSDLHALLSAANVGGPYVLVAHSYGGLIARLYASTYPDQVAGLVLIDTPTEYFYDSLTTREQEMWVAANTSPPVIPNGEEVNLPDAFAELRSAPPVHRVPAVVLTSDKVFDYADAIAAGKLSQDYKDFGKLTFDAHVAAQRKLAKILHAKLVLDTNSGHYIFVEQPELVISSIRQVVDQVRRQP